MRTEKAKKYSIDGYLVLTSNQFDRHKKFINDYLLYYSGTEADFKRDRYVRLFLPFSLESPGLEWIYLMHTHFKL